MRERRRLKSKHTYYLRAEHAGLDLRAALQEIHVLYARVGIQEQHTRSTLLYRELLYFDQVSWFVKDRAIVSFFGALRSQSVGEDIVDISKYYPLQGLYWKA